MCPAVPGAPARCRWGRRAATGPAGPCLWGRLETVHVVSLSELRNDADVSASGAVGRPGAGRGWLVSVPDSSSPHVPPPPSQSGFQLRPPHHTSCVTSATELVPSSEKGATPDRPRHSRGCHEGSPARHSHELHNLPPQTASPKSREKNKRSLPSSREQNGKGATVGTHSMTDPAPSRGAHRPPRGGVEVSRQSSERPWVPPRRGPTARGQFSLCLSQSPSTPIPEARPRDAGAATAHHVSSGLRRSPRTYVTCSQSLS